MKNNFLFCLVLCCFIFPDSASSSSVVSLTELGPSVQMEHYHWGEDVLIAAIYPYGLKRTLYADENFEGAMFPIYLGYISFDDQDDQKRIDFTPSHQANTKTLEAMFDRINQDGCVREGVSYEDITMDNPFFGVILWERLRRLEVRKIMQLPLGSAKDYDFSFIEQTEFRFEEAKQLCRQGQLSRSPAEWGIREDNFIITPKQ